MKARLVLLALGLSLITSFQLSAAVSGWLSHRGPEQNGFSKEIGLPDKIDPEKPLWRAEYPGQSTPVIANGKLYIMGFLGSGAELKEGVACFDAETGKKLWEQGYADFLSDIIYQRYASANPVIDPETGNVYMQGTQGILACFSGDGKELWKISMMETFGRLTFPNGRTASPIIDKDLVITRGITANWGAHGPGGDRFYAFDKKTGELVWTAWSGERPSDSSFSHSYVTFLHGKRVLISATGDGNVVCFNARTGELLWKVDLFKAGINAGVVVHNSDKVIAIYGTPYEPGHMVALKIPSIPNNSTSGPVTLDPAEVILWKNNISSSTSSPILVGDTLYVISEKGDLCSVDVNSGKISWRVKVGIEQRNASPLFADGKLYVSVLEAFGKESTSEGSTEAGSKGGFFIIKPHADRGEILSQTALDGRCFGSPVAFNGKVYIQTTRYLYCFGKAGNNEGLAKTQPAEPAWPKAGPATQLQIVPSEVLLRPGQEKDFKIRTLDANGFLVEEIKDASKVKWQSYVPPTARVRSALKGTFKDGDTIVADNASTPSAGAFQASLDNLKGYIRGRVLPYLPIKQDFEWATLSETNEFDGTMFAYPPLPWIGARFKFDIREVEGNKVLAKTVDNKFFQRGTVFLSEATAKNYTIQADIMTDGNRRKMSDAGIINHRYLIVLKGNEQKLEINSNLERLRYPAAEEPPNFRWTPKTWYTLKSRVDIANDGSGIVRAKAWKKGEPEPEKWLVEVKHENAHKEGSPGLFGFSPQDVTAYIDNVIVTPN